MRWSSIVLCLQYTHKTDIYCTRTPLRKRIVACKIQQMCTGIYLDNKGWIAWCSAWKPDALSFVLWQITTSENAQVGPLSICNKDPAIEPLFCLLMWKTRKERSAPAFISEHDRYCGESLMVLGRKSVIRKRTFGRKSISGGKRTFIFFCIGKLTAEGISRDSWRTCTTICWCC
jgi:hypothetical protein